MTVRILAVVLAASAAQANDDSFRGDFARQSYSAATAGGGALYAGYDVFRPFLAPATLSRQARTWEVGFADRVGLGGDVNGLGVAGAWAGPRTDAGTFGLGLLVSQTALPTVAELDVSGAPTGAAVSASVLHLAAAGLYQWSAFSFGATIHLVRESWNGVPAALRDQLTLDENLQAAAVAFGGLVALGHLDLGAQFSLDSDTRIGFGFAYHHEGAFPSDWAMDLAFPVGGNNNGGNYNAGGPAGGHPNFTTNDGSPPTLLAAGVTWHAPGHVEARVGLRATPGSGGNGLAPLLGVGVPWRSFTFAYGLGLGAVTTAVGTEHVLSVSWSAGRQRDAAAPQFFLTQSERTLAVAAFDPQGVSATDAAIISDMVRNRMIKEGAFNIVEKANMDKILGEQAFQQTGCTSSECAVRLGKVLNVKYLVVGSFGKLLDRYVVSLRVVDVETAKAVYSDEASAADVPGVQDAVGRLAANLTEAVKKAK